jgi:sec-independent protein translocase protein TatA
MPNIGPLELIVVAIIALVIFGPKRLPELGNSMGKGLREFRASIAGKDNPDTKSELEPGNQVPAERVDGEVVTERRF